MMWLNLRKSIIVGQLLYYCFFFFYNSLILLVLQQVPAQRKILRDFKIKHTILII